MANAAGSANKGRGETQPSQQGLAGLRLQHALPNARVLYASATGASTIHGLAYAPRLGLWGGDATAFNDRPDFVGAMERGGVAAMEIVARDLKALGLYQARALSYHGVEVDILEHALTSAATRHLGQLRWRLPHHPPAHHRGPGSHRRRAGRRDPERRGEVRPPTPPSSRPSNASSDTWLAAMKCPSLIRAIEKDLLAGRAPVIQLVSTGEALLERRLAELPPSEHADLSIDLTPREYVMEYLMRAFPTQLQEERVNDEGKVIAVPAVDDLGNPIQSQDALEARDRLVMELGALPAMPSAIDILTHHFGHEVIAEVTGRSRRVLALPATGGTRLAVAPRPATANLTEAAAFMDGSQAASSSSPPRAAPGAATTPTPPARTRRGACTTCWSPVGGPTSPSRASAARTAPDRPARPCSAP